MLASLYLDPRSIRRRMLLAARAAVACCMLLLTGLSQAVPADTSKELRIGIGLPKPPYIMPNAKAGLEYDIVEQALGAAGYKMVAQSFPPARALALTRAGQLDGMLTVTEGIGGNGYFSDTYIWYQNVAVTLASRRIELNKISDLMPYSVAAFQNASMILGEEFHALVQSHSEYREHSQQITQNRLLFTGRVDVVIGDRYIFRYLSQQLEEPINITQQVTFHPIFLPSPRKAVFLDKKVRDDFNAGLKAIRQNGAYSAILKKYRVLME